MKQIKTNARHTQTVEENEHTENICNDCGKPIRMQNNSLQLLCECGLKSI